MLEVEITKSEGSFQLASSFETKAGILGILGPSGSGKSLTLQCIAGLRAPDQGKISLNGRVLFDSKEKINIPPRQRKIGFMFQNYALFPHLNVFENIAFGLHHLSKKKQRERVSLFLEKINLVGFEKYYPSSLSGGQQQRVALARTLITEPDLLLLDEPFSALDQQIKSKLQLELLDIIKSNFTGVVLLVTHDMDEAYRLCDQMIIYSNGQMIQQGLKEDILEHPRTLTTAELTGCKNLFEVDSLIETPTHHQVKMKELSINIQKKNNINDNGTLIAGIHAHDLRLTTTSAKENTFSCDIIQVTDGIFSTTFFVACGGSTFQVELPKETAAVIKKQAKQALYLHIPEGKLFLVDNDRK